MKLGPRHRLERARTTAVLGGEQHTNEVLDIRSLLGESQIEWLLKLKKGLLENYDPTKFDPELLTAYFRLAAVFGLAYPERKSEFQLKDIPEAEIDYEKGELSRLKNFDTSQSLADHRIGLDTHLEFLYAFGLIFPEHITQVFPECSEAVLKKLDLLLETEFYDVRFWITGTLLTLYTAFPEHKKSIESIFRKHGPKIKESFDSKAGSDYPGTSYVFLTLILPEFRDDTLIQEKLPSIRKEFRHQLQRLFTTSEPLSHFHFDHAFLYQLALSLLVFQAESAELQEDGSLKLSHAQALGQRPPLPERSQI